MPWFFKLRLFAIEIGKTEPEDESDDGTLETVTGAYAAEEDVCDECDRKMGFRVVQPVSAPRQNVDTPR